MKSRDTLARVTQYLARHLAVHEEAAETDEQVTACLLLGAAVDTLLWVLDAEPRPAGSLAPVLDEARRIAECEDN